MEETKAIKAIQDKLDALTDIKEAKAFNVWQKGALHTLMHIYNENDRRIKSFEAIKTKNMSCMLASHTDAPQAGCTSKVGQEQTIDREALLYQCCYYQTQRSCKTQGYFAAGSSKQASTRACTQAK
jgi:hypothetical protein